MVPDIVIGAIVLAGLAVIFGGYELMGGFKKPDNYSGGKSRRNKKHLEKNKGSRKR